MNDFEKAIASKFDPYTFAWRCYFAPETLEKPFGLKEALELLHKDDNTDNSSYRKNE